MHDTEHYIERLKSGWHRIFHWLHRVPCLISYAVGGILGLGVALLRPRLRERAAQNVAQSKCFGTSSPQTMALRALFHAGVSVFDTLALWLLPWRWCRDWVSVSGWEAILTAQQQHAERGIIFLTPHLGCFEIAGAWVGHQQALTSMYRPPHQRWLDRLMRWGRQRGKSTLVPAELKGVRALLKSLKRGEWVGLLPDQVPQQGEGLWATFFGRPAYTMTLASRLQQVTNAYCVLVTAERRHGWGGICLHFEMLLEGVFEDSHASLPIAVQQMNDGLELAIRRFPEQYLWGYNRYKIPAGVEPPKVSNA